jgi:hypothetical protein
MKLMERSTFGGEILKFGSAPILFPIIGRLKNGQYRYKTCCDFSLVLVLKKAIDAIWDS